MVSSSTSFRIDAFVLPKQISHFLLANTHTHPWRILAGSNVFGKFCHVGLAEALQFRFTLIQRIEIRSPDGSANVQSCERVRKDCIVSECLHDSVINVRSEMETALIVRNTAVVLNAPAAVHAHDTHVVNPSNAKLDVPFWFHQGLGNKRVFGIAVENRRQTQ